MPIGAVIGGTAASGLLKAFGASQASKAQSKAADKAIQFAQQTIQPFASAGMEAWNILKPLLGIGADTGGSTFGMLTKPFSFTQQELETLPGYQFTKTEGLKALDNALSVRGGQPGNFARGAGDYLVNLLNKTYKDQYGLEMSQKQSIFDMLFKPTQFGGAAATNLASQVGGYQIGQGNAQAAGWNAGTAAIGDAISSGTGQWGNYMLQKPLYDAQVDYLRSRIPSSGAVANPLYDTSKWVSPY